MVSVLGRGKKLLYKSSWVAFSQWSWLVGRRQSIEPSDGTQIAGPWLTSEGGSAPISSPAPSLMPDEAANLSLSCLKLLQKILPSPQITTWAASAAGRKGNVIYTGTTGSTVVLVGHPKHLGTLPTPLISSHSPSLRFRSDSFTLKTQSVFAVAEISVYVALGIRDWFHGSSDLLRVMKLCLIVGQLLTCALVVPECYW